MAKSKIDMARLQRMASAEGFKGLDEFLENLPARVNKTVLIAGGVAWVVVAIALLYANMLTDSTSKLQDELRKTEALQPLVPQIVETPAPAAEMTAKLENAQKVFKDINMTIGDGAIVIGSEEPKMYGAFLQTIYLIMGMGDGYKVTMKEMCQGRDCKTKSNKAFLQASFDVKKLEVKSTESPSGG